MNIETNGAVAAVQQTAVPPEAQVMQFASGAFLAQAVYVAAKLGIADLLSRGPQSAEYVAVATSTNDTAIYRILRALASVGIFSELPNHRFANTPASDTLRSDHPRSTRDGTIWINEPEHWKVYSEMMHSVRTGEPCWEKVHGEPVFPYLFETNKGLGEIFNRAMVSFSHQSIPPILEAYDFSSAGIIADIAGGYGHLLAAILSANPNAGGILFDLPAVTDGAQQFLETAGLTDRVQLVAGDFLTEIPVVADVYILKHIIHDWYDETNQKILGNIRRSMPENAKLLIVEMVVPEGNEPHLGKVIDLEMLITPGGIERTAAEFERLLKKSGFKLNRIVPTASPFSIVEASKA